MYCPVFFLLVPCILLSSQDLHLQSACFFTSSFVGSRVCSGFIIPLWLMILVKSKVKVNLFFLLCTVFCIVAIVYFLVEQSISFHYFIWGNSFWYTSALVYRQISRINYAHNPRFYYIIILWPLFIFTRLLVLLHISTQQCYISYGSSKPTFPLVRLEVKINVA